MVHSLPHVVRRESPASADANRLPRIAVVDDSPEFVALLDEIFAERFEVVGASGQSIHRIAEAQPQLLIVDSQPASGLGGSAWQLVNLARDHAQLRDVPIIVCTTDYVSFDADGERLARLENVHLMAKPFALDVLETLVARLVPGARVETRRAAAS
jgi:CheY-like chemotaxis protein